MFYYLQKLVIMIELFLLNLKPVETGTLILADVAGTSWYHDSPDLCTVIRLVCCDALTVAMVTVSRRRCRTARWTPGSGTCSLNSREA